MNQRIKARLDEWMGSPNERAIIRYMVTKGEASRTELSKTLGVSMSTVTNVTEKLLNKNMINEGGLVKAERGRSMKLLGVNQKKFKAIGVGFNYLLLNVSLIDMEGKVYFHEEMPLDTESWQVNYKNAAKLVSKLLKEYKDYQEDILGIGLETPGFIEYGMRNLDRPYPFKAAFSVESAAAFLEDRFDYGVTSSSSFSGLLSGESYFGDARNHNHVINVNISSSGLGWARILDRKLDRKAAHTSGSIGHTVVNINGPQCTCSQNGCAELYTGKHHIMETYQGLMTLDEDYKQNHTMEDLSYHDVLEMGEAGDPVAVQAISKAASVLGILVANTAFMLQPDMVILSGRLIRESKLYFQVAKNIALKRLVNQGIEGVKIVLPTVNRAGSTSFGVATLVFEQIFLGE